MVAMFENQCPRPVVLKAWSQINNSSLTWERVRNAHFQSHPKLTKSETLRENLRICILTKPLDDSNAYLSLRTIVLFLVLKM